MDAVVVHDLFVIGANGNGNVPHLSALRYRHKGAGNKIQGAFFDTRRVADPAAWLRERLGDVEIIDGGEKTSRRAVPLFPSPRCIKVYTGAGSLVGLPAILVYVQRQQVERTIGSL